MNKHIVSGVVSCTGAKIKFNKKLPCMNKPARTVRQPGVVQLSLNIAYEPQIEEVAPHVPLTEDQLKEALFLAHGRHLKRDPDKVRALDMTYHFLKHMGYDEFEWEYLRKIMVVMKQEIDNQKK